jgi:hypothetical protein
LIVFLKRGKIESETFKFSRGLLSEISDEIDDD